MGEEGRGVTVRLFLVSSDRSGDSGQPLRWLLDDRHDCEPVPSGETGCTDDQSAAVTSLLPGAGAGAAGTGLWWLDQRTGLRPATGVGRRRRLWDADRQQPFFHVMLSRCSIMLLLTEFNDYDCQSSQ